MFMCHRTRWALATDIGGQTLEPETVVMYLEVLLDSHMTCNAHADNTAEQMRGILCYLLRTQHFLTEEATRLLMQTLVVTKLDYCSAVWGGSDKNYGQQTAEGSEALPPG